MDKPNLLIVGAGGVGAVAAHKAAQFHQDFGRIVLASRTLSKVEAITEDIERRWNAGGSNPLVAGAQVDARDPASLKAAIAESGAQILLNLASPYCNETILDVCLEMGVHYLDTAVAEREHVENMAAPWYSHVEWPRRPAFAEKGLNAFLGIGFDPGVVNVFCAYARKHLLESIETIDIVDVNGGDHHQYFATNFDADTNLREIKEDVIYWEDGAFKTIGHHSRKMTVTLPAVGTHEVYSMGHDEIHSLYRNFPEARKIEFWMGFGERYLQVFNVLNNLGLLSSIPVEVEGSPVELAPLKMVKAVLPNPSTLAANYTGEVCIGCDIKGKKDGQDKRVFIYSTCDHTACYREVGSQAISYTTGVPAVAAARLMARGLWNPGGMVHMEELDPDPFLEIFPETGIGWQVMELPLDGSWPA